VLEALKCIGDSHLGHDFLVLIGAILFGYYTTILLIIFPQLALWLPTKMPSSGEPFRHGSGSPRLVCCCNCIQILHLEIIP
jgi:hypothetical protein